MRGPPSATCAMIRERYPQVRHFITSTDRRRGVTGLDSLTPKPQMSQIIPPMHTVVTSPSVDDTKEVEHVQYDRDNLFDLDFYDDGGDVDSVSDVGDNTSSKIDIFSD